MNDAEFTTSDSVSLNPLPPISTIFNSLPQSIPNFTNYRVIHFFSQIPNLNPNISPFQWKPCAMYVFSQTTIRVIMNDPYIRVLTDYFLNTNTICSIALCQSVPYCNILWMILSLSNFVKSTPALAVNYRITYIHPIYPYEPMIHAQQHIPLAN
jgi:hypothetical protein